MPQLTLEYVLDSRRPGYTFTTPTDGLTDSMLRAVWRNALPRGQGWRAYTGAQSLKCFPLEGGRYAGISEVTVTDQADEGGRRGIRRADITILAGAEYLDYLTLRLAMLPEPAREEAERRLSWGRWRQIMDRAMPGVRRRSSQIVLTAPYTTPDDWLAVEATVLTVVTALRTRLLSGWPAVFPLTTLALDPREEGRVVAVPRQHAAGISRLHPILID